MTAQDGYQKSKDLIRRNLLFSGAEVPQETAPRGNMTRQLSDALPKAVKGKGREVCRWNWEAEHVVTKTAQKMEGQGTEASHGTDCVFDQCNSRTQLKQAFFCVVEQRDPITSLALVFSVVVLLAVLGLPRAQMANLVKLHLVE